MTTRLYTDEELWELRTLAKRVDEPGSPLVREASRESHPQAANLQGQGIVQGGRGSTFSDLRATEPA